MTTRDELEQIADNCDRAAEGQWSVNLSHIPECLRAASTALRLAARQEVSVTVEEMARSICRTDHINGAPSCVMDDHPERDPCGDENCRRFEQARDLLAKYSITNRTE